MMKEDVTGRGRNEEVRKLDKKEKEFACCPTDGMLERWTW